MFHNELKAAQFFSDFSSFSVEYGKAIKVIGESRK